MKKSSYFTLEKLKLIFLFNIFSLVLSICIRQLEFKNLDLKGLDKLFFFFFGKVLHRLLFY